MVGGQNGTIWNMGHIPWGSLDRPDGTGDVQSHKHEGDDENQATDIS